MNWIKDTIEYLFKLVQLWVTIMPWEEGIRVAFGKKQKLLKPGMHLRLPIVHAVYKQETRLRIVSMPVQTVTSKDGITITIIISIGYHITDIIKLYNNIFQPDSTISNIAMSSASKYIGSYNKSEIKEIEIEQFVIGELNNENFGIRFQYVKILSYAVVKTFRLIQDHHWISDNMQINTQA